MAKNLFKKRLIWRMVIAIGMVIAIAGSTLGGSVSGATATKKFPYVVRNLGHSIVYEAINNEEQIVGSTDTGTGKNHAVLLDLEERIQIDLGTLGGNNSYAKDINDAGKVIGFSQTISNDYHATLWDKGNKIDLGTLGGNNSYARAINNANKVVGYSETSNGDEHAFLWDNGNMVDLGVLGGKLSYAYDINDADKVIGYGYSSKLFHRAVMWDKGKIIDLGTLDSTYGSYSFARAINNANKVVGYSTVSPFNRNSNIHSALWDMGNKKDLGAFNGKNTYALSINKAGKVVGYSGTLSSNSTPSFSDTPFLWDKGSFKNLNNLIPPQSGLVLYRATSINDKGQILCQGRIGSGFLTNFRLTPVK